MLAASYGTTDDAEALTVAAYFAFGVAGLLWLQWFRALAVPFERRRSPLSRTGPVRLVAWSGWRRSPTSRWRWRRS